ncbi:MAG: glycolate oxidase subunit GlcE [Betaproteobacteria bacterium]|nr:MAG: glycolate oxidase subunit GlcE [Betaproteobacteria bacterium]
MQAVIEQFAGRIRAAAAEKRPLRLRGGGSKDFYGQALEGEVLDTRAYAGIIAYEPTELVITARCGTPLAELEAALRAQGQQLAFEPPHFGTGATVGGMVAAGLSGPRRQTAGAVRDFVLGVRLLDGRGDDLRFGGQVMKNVAGFDVSRPMAGSLGTLGLMLEISLKVPPRPFAEATLKLELPQDKALALLNQWGGKPLPLSACAWTAGELCLRLSGAASAVKAARAAIGGESMEPDAAERFWLAIREQTGLFFRSGKPLWRLSVPSIAPPLALPGEQLIEWGGSLRWLTSNADARTIRAVAAQAGGHATLFRADDKGAGVFAPLAPALAKIHRNLKQAFDPANIFNRGRMYPDL